MSQEACRFCGEFKSESALSSSLDETKFHFEHFFKITLDLDKLLPSLVCAACFTMFEKCIEFMQRIVDVQERLKTDLLEQLNEIPCDEFENLFLRIGCDFERLGLRGLLDS